MAGSITEAQWLQQYATRSQVERVLDQRDRLLLESSKLEAVADAARELARQWKEEEAGGQPLGWLIDALADALDALDEEE